MNNCFDKPDLSKLSIEREARPSSQRMILNAKMLIALTLGLFILAGTIVKCSILGQKRSEASFTSAGTHGKESSQNLGTADGYQQVLNATGYVVAQRKAAVSSKATGRLASLYVAEGDKVKQGQVLGVLENEDLAAAVRQEEANLAAVTSQIGFDAAELKEASLNKERIEKLFAEKAVSKAELDRAWARHRQAVSRLEVAKSNEVLARARLEKAKVDLSYTYILAPFDGTVLTKNADVGEIVSPFGASATSRAAIVTIADMSSLEVEADVSEANLQRIFLGQQCDITLDSLPGKVYQGVVGKIVPTVDRAKATVLTKIKFLNKDDDVIPEMSAKVAFKLKDNKQEQHD